MKLLMHAIQSTRYSTIFGYCLLDTDIYQGLSSEYNTYYDTSNVDIDVLPRLLQRILLNPEHFNHVLKCLYKV